ncbi:MAG: amidohydrolase [Acidimicrobiaceae bacterium]|nr:amidohydrolase [Acidimicrobiaceae bacterium]MBO0748130.1 amidohydrolase [Acidimicrobiaceae bacterium]
MFNGVKVYDVHGHVSVPPASNAYLASLLASNTASRSPLSQGGRTTVTEEQFRGAVDRHLAYMDERDIEVQIIGPRPFMMLGWMKDHLIPSWSRYVNDTIAQQCKFYPDRFLGAAQLPQNSDAPDISHVLPELDRCVNELGFVAAYLAPDPKGLRTTPGVNESYWYPLYERASELGLPLIVHGTNSQDPRHAPIPQNYQMGFVQEQYLATQLYGHTDVFERYPDLKVIVCHCGGGLDRFIRSDSHLSQKDLSNNLFFDTCAHDVDYLTAAIRQRTVPQTVFGTEAPGSGAAVRQPGEGPGKTGDDLVPVISSFDWLSDQDKQAILHDNPAKLFPAFDKV